MRLAAIIIAVNLCGCYTLHDCVNQSLIDLRDHCEAHAAWKAYRPDLVECEAHPHHFGAGFRDGYRAVAAGASGCPPTLPPRKYWCVLYQSDAGKQKMLSWYNGYAAGAAAAQQDGVQDRNRLVTASELYYQQNKDCPVEIHLDDIPVLEGAPLESPSDFQDDFAPPVLPEPRPVPDPNPLAPPADDLPRAVQGAPDDQLLPEPSLPGVQIEDTAEAPILPRRETSRNDRHTPAQLQMIPQPLLVQPLSVSSASAPGDATSPPTARLSQHADAGVAAQSSATGDSAGNVSHLHDAPSVIQASHNEVVQPSPSESAEWRLPKISPSWPSR